MRVCFPLLVAVAVAAAVPCLAQAPTPKSPAGYATGNGWRNSGTPIKEWWVQGFIDGYLVANYLATPPGNTEWLRTCLQGMKADQVAAIVEKYLENNPGEWHKPLSLSALAALQAACKR